MMGQVGPCDQIARAANDPNDHYVRMSQPIRDPDDRYRSISQLDKDHIDRYTLVEEATLNSIVIIGIVVIVRDKAIVIKRITTASS